MSRLKAVSSECKSCGVVDRVDWVHHCSCGRVHTYGRRPDRCFSCRQPVEDEPVNGEGDRAE